LKGTPEHAVSTVSALQGQKFIFTLRREKMVDRIRLGGLKGRSALKATLKGEVRFGGVLSQKKVLTG